MRKYIDHNGKLTFSGQQVAAELYDPAISTMIKWLAAGVAGQYSRYGKLPQNVLDVAEVDRDLREDIALETFMAALPGFLARLDREFDDTRSSMTTYFIGACRNRIGDVIRAHQVAIAELRPNTNELLGTVMRSSEAGLADFEGRELARYLLLRAPHDLRDVLLLHIYDRITVFDAAKELGLNPSTVRTQLRRFKKKLLRWHFTGEIDIPEDTGLGQWISARSQAEFGDPFPRGHAAAKVAVRSRRG
ncbi:RNA polymerase sigma factor [Nocardia thailandica]|uniref:RNA polymerase sigma factor n=1 Tax=Nocardia thailandica TaxID=257275 RepID=A0ABW6PI63_9NOCA